MVFGGIYWSITIWNMNWPVKEYHFTWLIKYEINQIVPLFLEPKDTYYTLLLSQILIELWKYTNTYYCWYAFCGCKQSQLLFDYKSFFSKINIFQAYDENIGFINLIWLRSKFLNFIIFRIYSRKKYFNTSDFLPT